MKRSLTVVRTRSQRELVAETMQALAGVSCRCPAHASPHTHSLTHRHSSRAEAASAVSTDYAYEIASSSVRVGRGVSKEVGMDVVNRGLKRVLLFTDKNVLQQLAFSTVRDALKREDVQFEVYDQVRVEPTDTSFMEAIQFAQKGQFDGFLAVGGGSVMDTSKVARLFDTYRDKELLDFVNQPIGKGEPILRELKPLICIPTTAGTGSETTGVAIFDLTSMKAKTGFSNRALCPNLALVDPLNTLSMPRNVAVFSGFDVLCHAIESYTGLRYNQRCPLPANPKFRPAYQGGNPISDIWAVQAIKLITKNFFRAIESREDVDASSEMSFASLLGGIGFGNAGVHLCHALSYPISGLVRDFAPTGYSPEHPIIPHGLGVVVTAPAVFSEVAHICPDRCIELAGLLGADTGRVRGEDAGRCLSDQLRQYMHRLDIPDGLTALGYKQDDIPDLVERTLPQERLTKLFPSPVSPSLLERILSNSLSVY